MSIRKGYELLGVDSYYSKHKDDYCNPHKEIVQKLLLHAKENWNLGENILDLCCGSGEVTEVFMDRNIEGSDAYTCEAYTRNTGKKCYNLSFKDIVKHGLEKKYDTIICSFAMHLCEESMLPVLLYRLAEASEKLVILTPHKRPECDGISGWRKVNSVKENRVTITLYEKNKAILI